MKKSLCECKSAPDYHRDDCHVFDSKGNLKDANLLARAENSSVLVISDTLKEKYKQQHFPKVELIQHVDQGQMLKWIEDIYKEMNNRIEFCKNNPRCHGIGLFIDAQTTNLSNVKDMMNVITPKLRSMNISFFITN